MPLVHQHHTCNNNPFNILVDDDNDDGLWWLATAAHVPHHPAYHLATYKGTQQSANQRAH